MSPVLFLPGSGASPDFWKPVGTRLPGDWPKHYFGWPGIGHQPPDPAVNGFEDLVAMVVVRMTEPVDLVAQSMGGVIAARVALEHPTLVRRLVLTVTSGGVDMAGLGASDWRPAYRQEYPKAASWIYEPRIAGPLPVERIAVPTLLLWGDNDPISPIEVGEHLAGRLPKARLHVVKGGGHGLAETHADEVAPLIAAFLA